MKKIQLQLSANKLSPYIQKLVQQLITLAQPVIAYYNRLSEREKQVAYFGVIAVALMFLYLFVSAAYSFQDGLERDYAIVQSYRADVEYLSKIYKDVNQLTPNEFSKVAAERIKGDFAAIAANPDIEQTNNTLEVNIAQAKFSDTMDVLNQLRKNYGIFPAKLKITRLSKSGYVSFSASFGVNTQNGE